MFSGLSYTTQLHRMKSSSYTCFPPQIVFSTMFYDPDHSVALTRCMATLCSPDLLHIIHGNGHFSQAVGDTVAGGILMSAQTRVLVVVMSCVCIMLVFALIILLLMSFILYNHLSAFLFISGDNLIIIHIFVLPEHI